MLAQRFLDLPADGDTERIALEAPESAQVRLVVFEKGAGQRTMPGRLDGKLSAATTLAEDQSFLARLSHFGAVAGQHLDDAGTADVDVLVQAEEIAEIEDDEQYAANLMIV